MKSAFHILPIVSALTLIWGCIGDAPHDNPLDPDSPAYREAGGVYGTVVLLRNPAQGIPGAQVLVFPSGLVALTDSAGTFTFTDVTAGSISIVAQKQGYLTDTIQTTVDIAGSSGVLLRLDALPSLDSTLLTSNKIDQWFPGPTYFAAISATVSDPDGISDIDSVKATVGSLSFPLAFSVTTQTFGANIFSYQLPTNNLQWLIGKEIRIQASDQAGAVVVSAPLFLSRIIEQAATPVRPANLDTVSASPLFEWTPPGVTFQYTYTINVVRQDAGNQTLIWTKSAILSSLRTYQYPNVLAPATYFWTISLVDEFGNVSQSKPSSFVVN